MNKTISKYLKKIGQGVTVLSLLAVLCACSMITQPSVQAIPSKPPPVSAKRLEEHVRFLSETVHPRNYEEEKNLNDAADYILAQLKETGAVISEQPFEVEGRQYRNIRAHFGSNEGAVMIVGAHYDSYADTPGADDNASGVAGLLELAHLLKNNPPEHPVELVAYTLEEPPFFSTENMGSAVHARLIRASEQPVSVMISLEMIGYFSDEADSQHYPVAFLGALYPDKGNFIGVIGRFADRKETRRIKALMAGATDLPVYSINAPSLIKGIDFSDHRNYWVEGYRAVMITDTAFFRNKHYHEHTDTADRLDYQRMAKVVQGVYAVVQGFTP